MSGWKIDEQTITALRAVPHVTAKAVARELEVFSKLADDKVEYALLHARKILEAIAAAVCKLGGIETENKTLEKLLVELQRTNSISALIHKHCTVIREFGNLAAHYVEPSRSSDKPLEYSNSEAEMCGRALGVVAVWFLDQITPRLQDLPTMAVVHGANICPHHMEQATQIDREVYPEIFWTDPATLCDWHAMNPDLFTMVVDTNVDRVVGCLTVLPLDAAAFRHLEDGGMIDLDIPASSILSYNFADFYNIYIASVVVSPSYQRSEAFRMMYEAYLDKLLQFARRGIFVLEVLADAITEDGERLCRFLGMKEIRTTAHKSKIFKVAMLPPELRVTTKKSALLFSYYQRKYEEMRELLPLLRQGSAQ